jgi:hypothetical protein
MCGYKVESTTSTTWPTTLVRDLAVHFSTLRCTGTSSPSQSLDIEFNYKQEKKGPYILKGRRRKSCSFSQGSAGRRIGSSRMGKRNRERGNDEGTQTGDAPYWFPSSSSSSSSFVFEIIRKLIGRVLLRCCWWCCGPQSAPALSNRTRQGPISSWHFVFYHRLRSFLHGCCRTREFLPVAIRLSVQPWKDTHISLVKLNWFE